jgi:hypothetical protein
MFQVFTASTCAFALSITLVVPVAGAALVTTVDMQLTQLASGSAPNSKKQPWMDVVFQDLGPNVVLLTITAPNLGATDYDAAVYLNYNDNNKLGVGNLVFTPVPSGWSGLPVTTTNVTVGKNAKQADGTGLYDIQINFSTTGGASQQFNDGDKVTYQITASKAGNKTFSALDFAFKSQLISGGTNAYAAASVFNGKKFAPGYIDAPTFSAVSVPEVPSGAAAAILCLGMLLFGWHTTSGHKG